MKIHGFARLALLVAPLTVPAAAQNADVPIRVSAQGRLLLDVPRDVRVSPAGDARMLVRPLEGDFHHLVVSLEVTDSDGRSRAVGPIEGNGFLLSGAERIVVTTSRHAAGADRRLAVTDLDGVERFVREGAGLSGARLSSDGLHLGFRSRAGLSVVDLRDLTEVRHPELAAFAPAGAGGVAGLLPNDARVLVVRDARDELLRESFAEPLRTVAIAPDAAALFVHSARAVWRIDLRTLERREVFRSGDVGAAELTDLLVRRGVVHLGLRRRDARGSRSTLLRLASSGALIGTTQGPSAAPLVSPIDAVPLGSLPWPLVAAGQRSVGNTYGEYQNYGGSPYMHPGVDVLGADFEPVFAVDGGVVKAILTTSGQYHWRVAVGAPGSGTTTGYLYAHLDLPTIAVQVGDTVAKGQYLGDLVPWPVASFTHCHFARIEDSGSTWSGDWLCTDDTHDEFWPQTESEAPQFENALGDELFAFCLDETSVYLDPNELSGRVDVIAHVGDRIASSWVCAVHELRYSIWPAGDPGSPVVDDKLAARFDMMLDTYADGPFDPFLVDLLYKEDSTCDTDGDYGSREFFHVVTNSDGDDVYEPGDAFEAWDTTAVPNGDYVVEVVARDAAGNVASASMTVTVDN